MVNYIPCSQCETRYPSVNWYVKRPLSSSGHPEDEIIWCMICYAKELYAYHLADLENGLYDSK